MSDLKQVEGKGFFLKFQPFKESVVARPMNVVEIVREVLSTAKASLGHVIVSFLAFPAIALGIAMLGSTFFPNDPDIRMHVRLVIFTLAWVWISYLLYAIQTKALKLDYRTNPIFAFASLMFWKYALGFACVVATFLAIALFVFSGLYAGWDSLFAMHGLDFEREFGVDFLPVCLVATIFTTIFLSARFCLVLPVILSEGKISLPHSWRLMKSNTRYVIPSLLLCLFPMNLIAFGLRTFWETEVGLNASYIGYAVIALSVMVAQIIAFAAVPAVFYRLNLPNWTADGS